LADKVPNTGTFFVVEPPWGSLTTSEGSKQRGRSEFVGGTSEFGGKKLPTSGRLDNLTGSNQQTQANTTKKKEQQNG
jgi:hypothetical protein